LHTPQELTQVRSSLDEQQSDAETIDNLVAEYSKLSAEGATQAATDEARLQVNWCFA
jgi:hypothetical protein